MSCYRVNVTDAVESLTGFTPAIKGDRYAQIKNRALVPIDGHFYVDFDDVEEISDEIKNIIIHVTSLERIPVSPRRERGIYKRNTAEVVVDYFDNDKPARGYDFDGKATSPEDLKILIRQIKGGVIRPLVSYDAEQVGKVKATIINKLKAFVEWLKGPVWSM